LRTHHELTGQHLHDRDQARDVEAAKPADHRVIGHRDINSRATQAADEADDHQPDQQDRPDQPADPR
jgi:hypothetical protein